MALMLALLLAGGATAQSAQGQPEQGQPVPAPALPGDPAPAEPAATDPAPTDAAPEASPAPLRVTVDGRAVIVTGPAGYCIDRAASREGPEGAFVLLGSCAALGGGRAVPKGAPAVLTASVAPGMSGVGLGPEAYGALAGFFKSPQGRTALSRAGKAESVEVRDVTSVGPVLYLLIEDRAAAEGQTLDVSYWRAILPIRGRMVTLSVLGHADRPISVAEKRALLDAFVARMTAVNLSQNSAAPEQ